MDNLAYQIMSNFAAENEKYLKKMPCKFDEYFNSKGVSKYKPLNMKDQSIVYGNKVGNYIEGPVIVRYINNTCYVGAMEKSQRHGFGYRSYADPNLYYAGEYKNDLKCGKGKLWNLKKQKWVFDGLWANDKKNGYGVLLRDEGVYEGNWVDDRMEGRGHMKWNNGDEYEGDFKQDLRHGIGIMKFGNGDVFRGPFRNGYMHGVGNYIWKNGEKYDGGFTDGVMDGHGRIEYTPINCVGQGNLSSGSNRNLAYGLSAIQYKA